MRFESVRKKIHVEYERIKLTPFMMKLMEIAGEELRISPSEAFRRLLSDIEAMVKFRIGKDEDINLGGLWNDVCRQARKAMRSTERIGGARDEQLTLPDEKDLAPIDLTLLETTHKNKTGFMGVSSTSSGKFRALVPDPAKGNTPIWLSSHDEAIDAAIERYRWFEHHGLPYGNLGKHIEETKQRHPEWSIERCLVHFLEFNRNMRPEDMKWPATIEQAQLTLERHRKIHGSTMPDPKPRSPAVAEALRIAASIEPDPVDGEDEA